MENRKIKEFDFVSRCPRLRQILTGKADSDLENITERKQAAIPEDTTLAW